MISPNAIANCPSPCYLVDTAALAANAARIATIRERTGTNVLLALKGFAMSSTFPILREALDGVCASGLYEARLGREAFGKQVHTYSPAFSDQEIDEVLRLSDHVTFNSLSQWRRFQDRAIASGVACGLRINPECSVADVPLYDPCSPDSRLGIRRDQITTQDLAGIHGLHLHALCEQDSRALETVLQSVEAAFPDLLAQVDWLNLGGGHHITRADYDIDHLCSLLTSLSQRYGLSLFLEPGEAVALHAGVLVATVLDIVQARDRTAILDISATCHMPDVLEMPYRPQIIGAAAAGEKPHTYRLGGVSCLAGDQIGAYSFDAPLEVGSRLAFLDMAHYTMVKTTMFNGVKHPAIATWDSLTGTLEVVRTFSYDDYRSRLA